ncbi:unnamed protein product [Durusdinium trenchii]|uniref:Uncharacterized protein n=1 Tax=Durusdinium trenchii TaxID=1381693 RepID=A0ABP0QXP3_9DINO
MFIFVLFPSISFSPPKPSEPTTRCNHPSSGYNVTERLTGAATVDAYFAVAGCLTPTIIGNRGCGDGPAVTYSHVSLEAWTEGYAATWEQIQTDYPATAPVNVGNMGATAVGYDGKVSFYIGRGVKEAAWESEGLNLDFFRGYNISWHLAAKYFDPPSVVNNSLLLPCNVTRLWISRVMQFYAELTGDWDGVDVNDGVVTAKCWEGKFWYAPSCRGNSSGCFVLLTGGNGWDLENSMQKATAWNMPMAAWSKGWAPLLTDETFRT